MQAVRPLRHKSVCKDALAALLMMLVKTTRATPAAARRGMEAAVARGMTAVWSQVTGAAWTLATGAVCHKTVVAIGATRRSVRAAYGTCTVRHRRPMQTVRPTRHNSVCKDALSALLLLVWMVTTRATPAAARRGMEAAVARGMTAVWTLATGAGCLKT